MLLKRKISANIIYTAANQLLGPTFSFFFVLVATRYLKPAEFGQYSLIMNTYWFILPMCLMGVGSIITKKVSENQEVASKYLGSAISVGIATSFLFATAALIYFILTDSLQKQSLISLITLGFFASSISECCQSVLRAFERFGSILLSTAIASILRTVLLIPLFEHGFRVDAAIYLYLFSLYINCAMNYVQVRQATTLTFDKITALELIKNMKYMGPIAITSSAFWRVDIFILSYISSLDVVGMYSAAQRILNLLLILPQSVSQAQFPAMSKMYFNNKQSGIEYTERTIKKLCLLTLGCAAFISIFSTQLVTIICGRSFAGAAMYVNILIWLAPPMSCVLIYGRLFIIQARQKFDLICNLLSMCSNLLFKQIALGLLGVFGAPFATLSAIVVFLLSQLIFLKNSSPCKVGKTAIICTTMACALSAINYLIGNAPFVVSAMINSGLILLWYIVSTMTFHLARSDQDVVGLKRFLRFSLKKEQ